MTKLSERIILEILEHEAIVLQAYKDSRNIWTWGAGVTSRSGHLVNRYIDRPTTLRRVLEVYEWLIRNQYLPEVLEAFEGYDLKEHELGAALSFHWNTGAIRTADWVKHVKAGEIAKAKRSFMNWRNPPEIIPRREAERDLFFKGVWANKGVVSVLSGVRRPSYQPDWATAKRVDLRPVLREVFHELA